MLLQSLFPAGSKRCSSRLLHGLVCLQEAFLYWRDLLSARAQCVFQEMQEENYYYSDKGHRDLQDKEKRE